MIKKENENENEIIEVVRPEGEMEINFLGKNRKVWWARIGYDSRVYFTAYFNKKLEEAVRLGLITLEKISNEIKADGKRKMYHLKGTPKEDTLSIKLDNNTVPEEKYTFDPITSVLYFPDPPEGDLLIEYESYKERNVFQEIERNANMSVLIFLSLRDIENHDKKIFSSPQQVGEILSMAEANDIISKYIIEIRKNEEEIKKLQTPPPGKDEEPSPSGGGLIPSEEKSGENLLKET